MEPVCADNLAKFHCREASFKQCPFQAMAGHISTQPTIVRERSAELPCRQKWSNGLVELYFQVGVLQLEL